jgi:hypothetical protein
VQGLRESGARGLEHPDLWVRSRQPGPLISPYLQGILCLQRLGSRWRFVRSLRPFPTLDVGIGEVTPLDVAALRAETRVAGVRVSGLVYDVATVIDTVVTP